MSSTIATGTPSATVMSPAVTELAILCDQLTDQCVLADGYGRIFYANSAATRQLGFSQKEFQGKGFGDLCSGRMPLEFYAALWKRIAGEKLPFMGKVRNIRKDDTPQWQEIYVFPLKEPYLQLFLIIEPDMHMLHSVGLELFSIQHLFADAMDTVHGFSSFLRSSLETAS